MRKRLLSFIGLVAIVSTGFTGGQGPIRPMLLASSSPPICGIIVSRDVVIRYEDHWYNYSLVDWVHGNVSGTQGYWELRNDTIVTHPTYLYHIDGESMTVKPMSEVKDGDVWNDEALSRYFVEEEKKLLDFTDESVLYENLDFAYESEYHFEPFPFTKLVDNPKGRKKSYYRPYTVYLEKANGRHGKGRPAILSLRDNSYWFDMCVSDDVEGSYSRGVQGLYSWQGNEIILSPSFEYVMDGDGMRVVGSDVGGSPLMRAYHFIRKGKRLVDVSDYGSLGSSSPGGERVSFGNFKRAYRPAFSW